jgi:hypothetical protein
MLDSVVVVVDAAGIEKVRLSPSAKGCVKLNLESSK